MLRSREEIDRNAEPASAMELACATIDGMAGAIRTAINTNNLEALLLALRAMRSAVDMVERWVKESPH